MRDIVQFGLIYVTQYFSTNVQRLRFFIGHHTFRGREDGDAEAALDADPALDLTALLLRLVQAGAFAVPPSSDQEPPP